MISIRDCDKARLEQIIVALLPQAGEPPSIERVDFARTEARSILQSIHDLAQEQAYPQPRVGVTFEHRVKAAEPTAVVCNRNGRTWIANENCSQLSGIFILGSLKESAAHAWESAAKRLGLV